MRPSQPATTTGVEPPQLGFSSNAGGRCVWLTGLSASGKSSISNALSAQLRADGAPVFQLDGDVLRRGLCADLGFSPEDRAENNRRAAEVAALLVGAGALVVAAFISPTHASRQAVREIVGAARFVEVYVHCPLHVCEARDPKGLYARSRAGLLPGMTGIDAPFEAPEMPELVVDTSAPDATPESCARAIRLWLSAHT
jgi:adenylyl-sulfate kinase